MNTKNTISTWLRRSAIKLGLMTMAITLFAAPAAGQTAENDVIENIASVTYEDANGNSYTKADTLQLTVGFKAGIATTPDGTTVTPASPSTGNEQTFTITNNGNGTDSVTVAASSDDTNVAAITGYKYNGTTYATLTLLNQALAGVAITAGNQHRQVLTRSFQSTSQRQRPAMHAVESVHAGIGGNTGRTANAGNQRDILAR